MVIPLIRADFIAMISTSRNDARAETVPNYARWDEQIKMDRPFLLNVWAMEYDAK